ncbi:glycoside hydrolase family [Paramyrothecium foliicola]|nr:glycoside hydrolase family [Paramyrothecium foliicola]
MKWFIFLAACDIGQSVKAQSCPGYRASNVLQSDYGLTADLTLDGEPCDLYGYDIQDLRLIVEYQSASRLHVLIQDADEQVFQIQEDLITRPPQSQYAANASELEFNLVEKPFSFTVSRRESGDVLFNTSSAALIFQSQYVRLSTTLPQNPNIYGLGEHSDPYRIPVKDNYQRTMWNVDAAFIPRRRNLYGSHPMYLEHRSTGTHGVLLLNSNGMDIKFNQTAAGEPNLEYNTIGGVLDFYFFAGPGPAEVSKQHAEAMGLPAMMPYWSLGFHQAKYGYWDVNYLAEVVANYSRANIPLEVIWADIDYMDRRRDFTVDPARFAAPKFRQFVDTVHNREQKFVMILDPAIAIDQQYPTYTRGHEVGAYLKADDGSNYRGVQWAGESVWPDWHSSEGQDWWQNEFELFFNPETGFDIDGIWIDMNEAANFCPNIDCEPGRHAEENNTPPEPANPPRNNTGRVIPGFPDSFQPQIPLRARKGAAGNKKGLPNRDLFQPKYRINNFRGDLSAGTIWTNITNHDGTSQYDTHQMYGLSMAKATYRSMVARRPNERPFVLTRSTFLTSGRYAAHWFGDTASTWDDYRLLIGQTLGFTTVHNMPMVGSDVCGFNWPAQELMCARWATLSSFLPFMRNHADISAPVQEFYQWESVTKAAQKGLNARYRLLDYFYTALYRSSSTGSPSINPLFFLYPEDENTWGIDLQFLFGDSILVCPVTDDESQTVTFYLPDDIFYDFWTHEQVVGQAAPMTLTDISWSDIPVYIRGGTIIPERSEVANTTDTLREKDFTLIVAPGKDGKAQGSLYLDDGASIEGSSSDIQFSWDGSTLGAKGAFGYTSNLSVATIVVLGAEGNRTAEGSWSLDGPFEVTDF